MSIKSIVDYPAEEAYGKLDHVTASLALVEEKTWNPAMYLYAEKIVVTVYKPAAEGQGILFIQDTNGNRLWETNVNTAREFTLNFGEYGVKISDTTNIGLTAVVSDAGQQATVYLGFVGHWRIS